jgi:hypothetical protein
MMLSPASSIADPAPFIEATLGRDAGLGYRLPVGWFRDAALTAEADQARSLQEPARAAAYAALQDRLLAAAPVAGLGSWTAPEYVAPRLGCRVFQPALGALDLGAACPARTGG